LIINFKFKKFLYKNTNLKLKKKYKNSKIQKLDFIMKKHQKLSINKIKKITKL